MIALILFYYIIFCTNQRNLCYAISESLLCQLLHIFFLTWLFGLLEKCSNTELFLVRIQSEYRKIWTRNNSVFGHFSRSDLLQYMISWKCYGNPLPFQIVSLHHKLIGTRLLQVNVKWKSCCPTYEFWNDFRFQILENEKILEKSQNWGQTFSKFGR